MPVTDIDAKKLLVEDLGLDSLDLCGLTVEIEEAFDIDIYDDNDEEKVKTVEDVVKYVEAHVKEARAA